MSAMNTALSKTQDPINELQNSLPKESWFNRKPIIFYQDFWVMNQHFEPIINFQNHFQALDTDIFTASFRKVGTTWLKALVFTLTNRKKYTLLHSPLLIRNPHDLVPHLETNIYSKSKNPNLISQTCPRIFGTHVPYSSLPSSIKDSDCKIVYIFRNPFDTFVSSWLFYQEIDDHKEGLKNHPNMMHKFFDMFCEGKVPYGPFPKHATGYCKASLERPDKVLFVRYEDLKEDPQSELKRIALFLGCPFSKEEVEKGVIDEIIKLCSFERLKEVAENNKDDRVYKLIQNDKFFRKGVVGDWVNFLTPSMVKKLKKVMEDEFRDSGILIDVLHE